ncbi:MAG: hypothetical protein GF417_10325, partial [Candidatus Latescibacteria bacterium]|nr:hypothetical protein [bacterium]MBD3424823.1 hypothetical protein [Candidatus Latescibacterota bacterium]
MPPGQEGKIRATVKTSHLPEGAFSKNFSVITNDLENEKLILTVRGTVQEVFSLSPPLHISGFLKEPIERKAQLSNKMEQPIHITGMKWRDDTDEMLKNRLKINV